MKPWLSRGIQSALQRSIYLHPQALYVSACSKWLPFHCISLRLRQKQLNFSSTPRNETRKHPAPAVDPSTQFNPGLLPVSLIDSSTQCRRLQTTGTKVEGEIHDGSEPALWLCGQHRAVAQRRGERRLQVARQIDLSFCLRDRRMLGIAEMAGPV